MSVAEEKLEALKKEMLKAREILIALQESNNELRRLASEIKIEYEKDLEK